MASFRFYTEDGPELFNNVKEEALKLWPAGFGLWHGQGVWHGGSENSLLVEVIQDDTPESRATARQFCNTIKAVNKQEAVLFQVIQNHHEFI